MSRIGARHLNALQASSTVALAAALLATGACGRKDEGPVDPAVETPTTPSERPATPFASVIKWNNPYDPTPQAICDEVVTIDVERLRGPDNGRVSLQLPCAGEIAVVRTGFEEIKGGQFIWRGAIEGDAGSRVTFSVVNDKLVGDIFPSGGRMFSIRYLAKSASLIEELDPAEFPPEEASDWVSPYRLPEKAEPRSGDPGTVSAPTANAAMRAATGVGAGVAPELNAATASEAVVGTILKPAAKAAEAKGKPGLIYDESKYMPVGQISPEDQSNPVAMVQMAPLADEPTNIDVMVLYTAAAAKFGTHPDAVLGEINQAISDANLSYTAAGIRQKLTLAHVQQTEYVESASGDLDYGNLAERRTTIASLKEVDNLRSSHKADIVVLVTKAVTGMESCGYAFQMDTVSNDFCSSAFAVVPITCANSTFSFVHELGHVMGAGHNVEVELGDGRMLAPFNYSRGYVSPTHKWRTIMSETTEKCVANTCLRKLEWSRPFVDSEPTPVPVPDAQQQPPDPKSAEPNNAATIANTAKTVAKFSEACAANAE